MMLRLGFGTRIFRGRASFAASKVRRQSGGAPLSQQSASASEAAIEGETEVKKACVISAAVFASVLVIAQTAKDIADKAGQTAIDIADKAGQTAIDIATI